MKKLIHIASVLAGFALLLAASCTQPSTNGTEENTAAQQATNGKSWRSMKSCGAMTATLPAGCEAQTLCDDVGCADTIRKLHEISVDTFAAMRSYYDNGTMYNGKEIPRDKIAVLVNAAAQYCGDYQIVLNDESAGAHNDSLTFALQISMRSDKVRASYTIALFKSILNAYPEADKFSFYKAAHADGCKDIIFEVLQNTDVLYNGDLSGLEP